MEAASLEMYHKLWNFVLVDAAVKPRAKQLFPPFNMNGYSSNLIFGLQCHLVTHCRGSVS